MVQRIYTGTGDRGETGLYGGGRVSKAHPRVEAYGAVDELNATLGVAIATLSDERIRDTLAPVQADLFAIGAHLATPPPASGRRAPQLPELPVDRSRDLEASIDAAEAELPQLRSFVLPGGSASGAALHFARTVCRRAERRVVALAAEETVDEAIFVYLNRLSDLLFVLARLANHRARIPDRPWQPRSG